MKAILSLLVILSFSFSQNFNDHDDLHFENKRIFDDEFSIKKYGDIIVHIDEDYNLYIEDEKVEIDDLERELLKDYVHLHRKLVKKAFRIGKAGAKLGIKAGAIAVSTTFSALGDIFSGNEKRAERKFEKMEKEIEYDAEDIEELGEEIERIAEELEEVRDELKDRVRKLRYIDEF